MLVGILYQEPCCETVGSLELCPKSLPNLDIAVSHPTIARPHDDQCSVASKAGCVCLTNFPDHAVFIAEMHLPGPPLHMLCAAWHVSDGQEARRQTKEDSVI